VLQLVLAHAPVNSLSHPMRLAPACHYRVAQRNARIALPELTHGVVRPSGSQRLPRAVAAAKRMHDARAARSGAGNA
jgi:enoyl-CoA hydratase/carnithine racemase